MLRSLWPAGTIIVHVYGRQAAGLYETVGKYMWVQLIQIKAVEGLCDTCSERSSTVTCNKVRNTWSVWAGIAQSV